MGVPLADLGLLEELPNSGAIATTLHFYTAWYPLPSFVRSSQCTLTSLTPILSAYRR